MILRFRRGIALKLAKSHLTEFVRETLLRERAQGPDDLPPVTAVGLTKNSIDADTNKIKIVLDSPKGEGPRGRIEILEIDGGREPYRVDYSWTDTRGWGPLLYDLALEYAGQAGLAPDPLVVSPQAEGIWRYYHDNRSDVTKQPISDSRSPLNYAYFVRGTPTWDRLRAAGKVTGGPGSAGGNLTEDKAGFQRGTSDVDYYTELEDPTFEQHPAGKIWARRVKSIWNREADHAFFNSLTKVHWIEGWSTPDAMNKSLTWLTSASGKDEISTTGYLPSSTLRSSWGEYGVVVKGRTTLAAEDMDVVVSGYHRDVPEDVKKKYEPSGIPKRSLKFRESLSDLYILGAEDFSTGTNWATNELIVDNWKPVAIVVPDFFMSILQKATKKSKLRQKLTEPERITVDIAAVLMEFPLPLMAGDRKPVDRKKVNDLLEDTTTPAYDI